MSKELKASVLAKCGELAPTEAEYHVHPKYNVRRVRQKVTIYGDWGSVEFKENTPDDDDVWPLAAQILGIQEARPDVYIDGKLVDVAKAALHRSLGGIRPEPSPSDDLLWQAWEKASAFGWVLCAAGTDKREYINARKEAFEQWLSTIKNSSNALEQGINE